MEFDDGIASGSVTTNSIGYRGRDPFSLGEHPARTLLISDSFAFGNLLDDSQTIDSQVEALLGGAIQAFNLGVGGFGAFHVLETLCVNSWFTGGNVFYLFYLNDLRYDAITMENNLVYRGTSSFVVMRMGDLILPRITRRNCRASQLVQPRPRQSDRLLNNGCRLLVYGTWFDEV